MAKSDKPIQLTAHALDVLKERGILDKWVFEILRRPAKVQLDPRRAGVRWAFVPIAEFGDRMLRVVYSEDTNGFRVITTFFDRRASRRRRTK